MDSINRELLDFIDASPTACHAAANVAKELEAAGYTRIYEDEDWQLSLPGKYYVVRNSSSLIALNLPEQVSNFLIMAAHDDAPVFRIKIDGEEKAQGLYTRLGVEKYGGMLCSTWLDRPLSIAGRVAVRENGKIVFKLVNIDRDLVLIPNLAIHMDRSANDSKSFNVNVDMMPLLGGAELKTGLIADPALILRLRGQRAPEKSVYRAFHDELAEGYRAMGWDARAVLCHMKEIWTYMAGLFAGSEREAKRIRKANTLEAYADAVDAIFALPLRSETENGKETH